MIANARMYAVTPEAEALWRRLLAHVAEEAEVRFDYLPYPAPQPLEELWRRPDLGCVFMCGYPIALGLADVVPLAAPIPRAAWAKGRAVYRSDLIVRKDAPFTRLEETFSGTLGWTVAHSHSGFNALRRHLMHHRTEARPSLYARVKGDLVTARNILDGVLDGAIDIGPLDAFWHMLIAHWKPELTAGIRVLDATDTAPMPAFVTRSGMPEAGVARLRAAFASARSRPWFAELGDGLLIDGFETATPESFATTLEWHRAAIAAGYPLPA
jgi:ABC-type phosphate/phosphonate transport system substrate-binding protein